LGQRRDGTAYWSRSRVEILLVGTSGNVPAPAPGEQPLQLIEALRTRHSEKPAVFYQIIEKVFPNVRKIELFARAMDRGGIPGAMRSHNERRVA